MALWGPQTTPGIKEKPYLLPAALHKGTNCPSAGLLILFLPSEPLLLVMLPFRLFTCLSSTPAAPPMGCKPRLLRFVHPFCPSVDALT